MATFDKKLLANIRGKAMIVVLVVFGLASCKSDKGNQNDNNAQTMEMYFNKMDSLYRANSELNRAQAQLTHELDSVKNVAKAAEEKAAAKKSAPQKKTTKKAAPKKTVVQPQTTTPVIVVAPVADNQVVNKETVDVTAESQSTFKIVAGDSVKIGKLRAHGNADGEVKIEITGGAQIDELDMSDYRTDMPAPVVQQVVAAPVQQQSTQPAVVQSAPVAQPTQVQPVNNQRPYKYTVKVVKTVTTHTR